jgi:hypothetical protein
MSMTYDKLIHDLDAVRRDIQSQAAQFKVPGHANPFAPQYDAVQFAISYFRSNDDDMREALGEFDDPDDWTAEEAEAFDLNHERKFD